MSKLCVPVTDTSVSSMLDSIHSLPPEVEMVEVRLDYLQIPDYQSLERAVVRLCRGKDRPAIFTNRPIRSGGRWEGDEGRRLDLIRRAISSGAEFIDVELEVADRISCGGSSCRKIVSYHNFKCTPPDLQKIYGQCQRRDADIVKIAVLANDMADTVRMIELLRERGASSPLIALSMGEAGVPTRVLAPRFGGFLTYGSYSDERASAPGQVTWKSMLDMYRFHNIGPDTALYGVVANPVMHSMSPVIHNAAFAECGMNAVYLPFKVADGLGDFLDAFQNYGLKGLSVTIPHKEKIMGFMDEVDDMASNICAVNTVTIRDGMRYGSNTDVEAAIDTLRGAAKRADMLPLDGRRALLVGAGGAARAVATALTESGVVLTIANRTVGRAQELAQSLGADFCGLDEMEQYEPDIIINTTSVGMYPEVDRIPVPASLLRKNVIVMDAVYNPIETKLLRIARGRDCVTASGFEWFISQAAGQFETWTGRRAPRKVMEEVARERLQP